MSKVVTKRAITAKIFNGDITAKDCDFRDNLGYNTTRFFVQLEERELEEYLSANGWFVTSRDLYLRGTLDAPDILVRGGGLTGYTQIYVFTAGEAYNPINFPGLVSLPDLETTEELMEYTIDLSLNAGGLFDNPTPWKSVFQGAIQLGTTEPLTEINGFIKHEGESWANGRVFEYEHELGEDIRIVATHDDARLTLWTYHRNGAEIKEIKGVIDDIAGKLLDTKILTRVGRNYGDFANMLADEIIRIRKRSDPQPLTVDVTEFPRTPKVDDEDGEVKTPWVAKCTCGESLFFGTLFAIFALTIEHMVRH